MRSALCFIILIQVASALTLGRPHGELPDKYYTFNGEVLPQKIVRIGERKDSTYDTLFIEDIKYDGELIGLCNRTPFENGAPSEYLFYYDSTNSIDMIRVNVLDNNQAQPYSQYTFSRDRRVDSLFSGDDTLIDSVSVTRREMKVAMIPGYPLEKFRKQESYIRLGDSTDTSVTYTTDYYNWMLSTQGSGGYYRYMRTGKEIVKEGISYSILVERNSSDTSFEMCEYNSAGDTVSVEAYILSDSLGRVENYKISFSEEENRLNKVVEVYNRETKSWRDSITYKSTSNDGAYSVEVFVYDTLTKQLEKKCKEIHTTTLNPKITYYEWNNEDEGYALIAEDYILYDTSVIAVLTTEAISCGSLIQGTYKNGVVQCKGVSGRVFGVLYTLTGREIKRVEAKAIASTADFNIPGIASGVYLFSISTDKNALQTVIPLRVTR